MEGGCHQRSLPLLRALRTRAGWHVRASSTQAPAQASHPYKRQEPQQRVPALGAKGPPVSQGRREEHGAADQLPRKDGFDVTGVRFPTPLSDIARVERQNNLAINVFGCEQEEVTALRSSTMPGEAEVVNLVFTTNAETGNTFFPLFISTLLFFNIYILLFSFITVFLIILKFIDKYKTIYKIIDFGWFVVPYKVGYRFVHLIDKTSGNAENRGNENYF